MVFVGKYISPMDPMGTDMSRLLFVTLRITQVGPSKTRLHRWLCWNSRRVSGSGWDRSFFLFLAGDLRFDDSRNDSQGKLGQIIICLGKKDSCLPDICLGNQEFVANPPSSNRVSGTREPFWITILPPRGVGESTSKHEFPNESRIANWKVPILWRFVCFLLVFGT